MILHLHRSFAKRNVPRIRRQRFQNNSQKSSKFGMPRSHPSEILDGVDRDLFDFLIHKGLLAVDSLIEKFSNNKKLLVKYRIV